jgi:hypothetical protein
VKHLNLCKDKDCRANSELSLAEYPQFSVVNQAPVHHSTSRFEPTSAQCEPLPVSLDDPFILLGPDET